MEGQALPIFVQIPLTRCRTNLMALGRARKTSRIPHSRNLGRTGPGRNCPHRYQRVPTIVRTICVHVGDSTFLVSRR